MAFQVQQFILNCKTGSKFHRARLTMYTIYFAAFLLNTIIPTMDYHAQLNQDRKFTTDTRDTLVFTICVSTAGLLVAAAAALVRRQKVLICAAILLFINLAISAYGFNWSPTWSVIRMVVNIISTFGTLALVMILTVDENRTAERMASLQDACNMQLPKIVAEDELFST